MKSDQHCIFCKIVNHSAEASVLYEDDRIIAFMNIKPVNPGEFMIIPKEHIDHFCDIADELACRIIVHAQRLSRNLRERLKPERVGLVVHGYGVPHAHLIIVPLREADDITSAKYGYLDEGQIKYGTEHIREPSRAELDELAQLLS